MKVRYEQTICLPLAIYYHYDRMHARFDVFRIDYIPFRQWKCIMNGNNTMRTLYIITFLRVLLLIICWLLGGNTSSALRAFQHSESYRTTPPSSYARVGVVNIEGPIESSEPYLDEFTVFFSDPSIQAILLVISSPGGLAGVSSAIVEGISELKEKYPKPVVTWVDEICASGAYLIAAGASDAIVIAPQATVGSVGVIYQTWRFKKFLKQWGISRDVLSTGNYKSFGNPYIEDDAASYDYMQQRLDEVYNIFIEYVERGRPQLRDIPHEQWADGKIFIGKAALEVQLVDKIGGHLTVQDTLRELADIEGPFEWVYPVVPHSNSKNYQAYVDEQKQASSTHMELIRRLFTLLAKPGIRMEYLP